MNEFDYFTEIEETFVRRRGRHLLVGPKDWVLIESWKDRGVPEFIVIATINSVFDEIVKKNGDTGSVSSLAYFRKAVEKRFTEWHKSQIGKSADADDAPAPELSIETIANYLDRVLEQLSNVRRTEIMAPVASAIKALRDLRGSLTSDLEAVDVSLNEIEKTLDAELLERWDRQNMEMIRIETGAQLADYKADMAVDAYENTFQIMLLKRLREDAGIPRLGLFYL